MTKNQVKPQFVLLYHFCIQNRHESHWIGRRTCVRKNSELTALILQRGEDLSLRSFCEIIFGSLNRSKTKSCLCAVLWTLTKCPSIYRCVFYFKFSVFDFINCSLTRCPQVPSIPSSRPVPSEKLLFLVYGKQKSCCSFCGGCVKEIIIQYSFNGLSISWNPPEDPLFLLVVANS